MIFKILLLISLAIHAATILTWLFKFMQTRKKNKLVKRKKKLLKKKEKLNPKK